MVIGVCLIKFLLQTAETAPRMAGLHPDRWGPYAANYVYRNIRCLHSSFNQWNLLEQNYTLFYLFLMDSVTSAIVRNLIFIYFTCLHLFTFYRFSQCFFLFFLANIFYLTFTKYIFVFVSLFSKNFLLLLKALTSFI